MSEADAAAAVLPPEARPVSPLGAVAGTFAQPGRTFERLMRKPTWWLPLVLAILASAIASFAITPKIDLEGTIREQMEKRAEKSGRQVTPEQVEQGVGFANKFARLSIPIGIVGSAVVFFLVTLVLWGGARAFGSEARFAQIAAIWGHANLVNVVKALVAAGALAFQPDGSMTQKQAQFFLKSNVAAFLPPDSPSAFLSFASWLDVFAIWALVLLVIGFRRIPDLKRSHGTAVPLTLWAILVILGVAWAAVFG